MSAATPSAPVAARLSMLDRFLPVWIGVAMVAGLLLGRLVPSLAPALEAVDLHGISLPIALGLLVMMYPVLAKVRYDRLDTVTGDRNGVVFYADFSAIRPDTGRRLVLDNTVVEGRSGPALLVTSNGGLHQTSADITVGNGSTLKGGNGNILEVTGDASANFIVDNSALVGDVAVSAGGAADPTPTQDFGFMYGRSFEDPDGHIWEVMFMDMAAAQGASA